MCFSGTCSVWPAGEGKSQGQVHTGVSGSGTAAGNRAVYLVPPYFPAPGGIRHIYGGSHTGRETASPAVLRRKAAFRSHSLFAAYIHVPCAGKRPVDGFGMPCIPYGTWRADAVEGTGRSHGHDGRGPGNPLGTQKQTGFTRGMAEGCEEHVQIREEVRAWPRPPYLPSSLPWF